MVLIVSSFFKNIADYFLVLGFKRIRKIFVTFEMSLSVSPADERENKIKNYMVTVVVWNIRMLFTRFFKKLALNIKEKKIQDAKESQRNLPKKDESKQ